MLEASKAHGGSRAKPWSGVQGAEGPRKLLDLSHFGRPMIHFQTAQKLVVNCK